MAQNGYDPISVLSRFYARFLLAFLCKATSMTPVSDNPPVNLTCQQCGYDLRAHAQDGNCPECGLPVAHSREIASIPRRPAWRESDPRWRRRVLAGAWILVLLPLMDLLQAFECTSSLPIPTVFDLRGDLTLHATFLANMGVYESLVFCMGIVLLFAKERGRRSNRLDWTRRWGVLCTYVVLLLCTVGVLSITALVVAGIGAHFLNMPLRYQPGVTQSFINVSAAYLRYGPYPKEIASAVLVGFSSTAILLACLPLFNALRSSGPKWLAGVLLAPLGVFSVINIAQAIRLCLGPLYQPSGFPTEMSLKVYSLGVYFRPGVLVRMFFEDTNSSFVEETTLDATIEATKWCIILAVAIWLTISQLMARRQRTAAKLT